ncbi:MAG TPA: hypothetical protein VIM25_11265, partial [Candidatus Limnocylindrales bacterium]
MPFWRRRHDEPTTPEAPREVDPDTAPADWEPDPADFDDPAGTAETAAPDEPATPATPAMEPEPGLELPPGPSLL